MNRSGSFAWRPRTTVLLLGGFGIVLVALVVSYAMAHFKPTVDVWVNNNTAVYKVWLADTDAKRTQGLSGVEKLNINGGMLFVYDTNSECGIWMKDMLIPLDIIWLDQDKQVIYIKEKVGPELSTDEIMKPRVPCRYVLELPAGSVKGSAIKQGQQVKFTLEGETQ